MLSKRWVVVCQGKAWKDGILRRPSARASLLPPSTCAMYTVVTALL